MPSFPPERTRRYCNSLFIDLPKIHLSPPQAMLNAAAGLIACLVHMCLTIYIGYPSWLVFNSRSYWSCYGLAPKHLRYLIHLLKRQFGPCVRLTNKNSLSHGQELPWQNLVLLLFWPLFMEPTFSLDSLIVSSWWPPCTPSLLKDGLIFLGLSHSSVQHCESCYINIHIQYNSLIVIVNNGNNTTTTTTTTAIITSCYCQRSVLRTCLPFPFGICVWKNLLFSNSCGYSWG